MNNTWRIRTSNDKDWATNTYKSERKKQLQAMRNGNKSEARDHRLKARGMLNKLLSFHEKGYDVSN